MNLLRRLVRHFNHKTKWHKQQEQKMKDSFADLGVGDFVIYLGPKCSTFTYGQIYVIRVKGQHNVVLINDDNHSHYLSEDYVCENFGPHRGKYYYI